MGTKSDLKKQYESDPEKKHKVVSEQDVGNTYHANSILGFESSVPA